MARSPSSALLKSWLGSPVGRSVRYFSTAVQGEVGGGAHCRRGSRPGRAATPLALRALRRRAGTRSRRAHRRILGPGSAVHHAAPDDALHRRGRAALRPGHKKTISLSTSMSSRSRGALRPSSADRFALIEKKGRREGRAPAGTQGPHARNARVLTTGDAGLPAFPAQWFYGLWRALFPARGVLTKRGSRLHEGLRSCRERAISASASLIVSRTFFTEASRLDTRSGSASIRGGQSK